MIRPKVSIVMGTYNRAHILRGAIESVLAQSFKEWELIIADDGSTDTTPALIAEWCKRDSRITYVRSNHNRGVSKNYNSAFRIAQGEYVAMIDDDDAWQDPDKLAKQINFLDNHKDYVGCGGGVIVIDAEGRELFRYIKPETDIQIREKMLFSNQMASSTTVFRLAAAQQVGWYEEEINQAGDRDFWLKMGLIGKLYNFPEYFANYTMSGGNISIYNIRPHLKASLTFMKRYKGKYPHYYPALLFNLMQYGYAFLPILIRGKVHPWVARLKRWAVG